LRSTSGAVLAALLGAVAAISPATADAAEATSAPTRVCPPSAVVEGPPEIVSPVVAILREHGLGTPSRSCAPPIVKASLVAHSGAGGYRLHVLDAAGHRSDRQVADAATAASLIESWALDEDADLWAPRPVPAASEAVAPPAVLAASDDAGSSVRATAQLGVMGETSISPDGAVWWGAGASACARVRALCIGGRGSISRADTTLEISRALGIAPDLTRTLGGVSAFVAWPIPAGRFWVAPSLGLGAAWLHSNATQAGVTSTTDDVLGRAAAGALVGLTLGKSVSVAFGVGGSAALVLRGDDRATTTTYIPAVPRGLLTAGVGLWYAP
jgi:hypothetical protein